MSYQKVKDWLDSRNIGIKLIRLEESSATVKAAAKALGCAEAQIAKTLSLSLGDTTMLIVTAGDVRIDNHKYKAYFHKKARFIPAQQVQVLTGYAPGGVCPFALRDGILVYLDVSLRRFDKVYPAGGDDHSAVVLRPYELETLVHSRGWIDVCTSNTI